MASQKEYLIIGIQLRMSDCGNSIEQVKVKSKGFRRKTVRELQVIWKKWDNLKKSREEKDWYARMGREQEEGIADYS